MTHQIDQLKEEIQNKEQALVKGKLGGNEQRALDLFNVINLN